MAKCQSTSVITIGNFDGVHLGHQSIVQRARQLSVQSANPGNTRVVAMCFDPHPAAVLRPAVLPPRISSAQEKTDLLKKAGADEVVVLKSGLRILSQTPWQFIENLVEKYNPLAIVEGDDFHFGKDRAGDMPMLSRLGKKYGFQAVVEPVRDVTLGDRKMATVSSSLVRWLIGRGRMKDAAICLGRCYQLTAPVVAGEKQGRKLGVPTANLDLQALSEFIIPVDGVYGGYVDVARQGEKDKSTAHLAAISVGQKPTFGKKSLAVEAHLLDYSGDLYGQKIRVRFARFLRDQFMFPDIESLKEQMARDVQLTRSYRSRGLMGH